MIGRIAGLPFNSLNACSTSTVALHDIPRLATCLTSGRMKPPKYNAIADQRSAQFAGIDAVMGPSTEETSGGE
jgi:hypothetical protein